MNSDGIKMLYNLYSRQVYIYAFSLCKNRHLAEDLMQDAFVKAMLSLECSHGNVKAWLFRVCRNLWIDHVRKSKHLSDIAIENIHIEDTSSGFLDDIIQAEKALKMYKTILSMSSLLREVLILYYYLELPQNKISEIMNISNGAVRTLLYRARNKLKTMVEENIYEI
ncbi:RNA polymerase sigma factor [Clostridium sp.]|uniref:RNA polymerase sigma factor n=1 Tax=Clostridium sp. TaxID=1506 RepID=UPI001A3E6CB1|nr:RNA polymerase sigma factor [Clostridium sp.]MBK5235885.1 RNA polymerase sigma factor [Clostridium sp.]